MCTISFQKVGQQNIRLTNSETSIHNEYKDIRIFQFTKMPESLRRLKADFFQALAHPTRVAIIEFLGQGELSAGELIDRLGMDQGNVSQHLAILRSRQLVVNRKAGNQVFYSVRDPLLLEVFALMRRYFQKHLAEAMAMLDEINTPTTQASARERDEHKPE